MTTVEELQKLANYYKELSFDVLAERFSILARDFEKLLTDNQMLQTQLAEQLKNNEIQQENIKEETIKNENN